MKGLRNLIVILAVAAIFCAGLPWVLNNWLNVPNAVRPVIQLPGEALTTPIQTPLGPIALTNTLLATLFTYLILIVMALAARAGIKEVPSGFANAMEAVIEMLFNISEQTIGHKHARRIFPIAATIFLAILIANLSKMLPGFESVGFLHHAHEGTEGDNAEAWILPNTYILRAAEPTTEQELEVVTGEGEVVEVGDEEHAEEEEAHTEESEAEHEGEAAGEHGEEAAGEHEGPCEHNCVVTPFLRGAATDINFPLALAVVSFVTIQLFGLAGLGLGYLGKFINLHALEKGGMGYMDFGVGLLDLILEPIKIVSLTFRLLGNIFGGAVLVIVVSTLVPFLLPTALYGYELFVGVIQAYVFFMLTLVFSAMAMVGHGGGEEGHH